MFSNKELRRLGVSETIRQRVSRKHLGGTSGAAGYRQEDYFAIAEMIAAAASYVRRRTCFSLSQNARALVDDVVTKTRAMRRFYQLKSGATVRWGPASSALRRDFRDQLALCARFRFRKFQLYLVVPTDTQRRSLVSTRPAELTRTFVRSFPRINRLSDLSSIGSPVHHALASLCAGPPRPADLEQIASAAVAAWLDRRSPMGFYSVDDFVADLRKNSLVPVRFPFRDKSPRYRAARRVLSKIQGLKVSVENGFFYFDYRGIESGRTAKCGTAEYRHLLDRIVREQPKTFDDFAERVL